MVRSFTLVLMAALTLLSAPEVHAGRRHDGHRCRRDAECLSGTCCNGRCSPQSACANELAGPAALVTGGGGRGGDAAPNPTGTSKPPASNKCTGTVPTVVSAGSAERAGAPVGTTVIAAPARCAVRTARHAAPSPTGAPPPASTTGAGPTTPSAVCGAV